MRAQFRRLSTHWQLVAAVALVLLIATLGTLQYRWLGEVSEAERTRMRDSLRARATEFTAEFDRELTRIYLEFQADTEGFDDDPAGRMADALARTQRLEGGSSLVKEVFLLEAQGPRAGRLQQLNAAARTLAPVEWPDTLDAWRKRAAHAPPLPPGALSPIFIADAVDAAAPALVVPVPQVKRIESAGRVAFMPDPAGVARAVIVWLDADRLQRQLLEPLMARYFGQGDSSEYVVAIVRRDDPSHVVYSSPEGATIEAAAADVTAGLFDLRMNDLSRVVGGAVARHGAAGTDQRLAVTIFRRAAPADGARVLMTGGETQGAWQMRARYRRGSLEAIVTRSRRSNLAISLGVLGLLAASFLLIAAVAHRQQQLGRQQLEFVASVSHELRTPLAVICSAGENLADGVVADSEQVKRYGSLIETEGRRLADMVERVMQFASIGSQSPARGRGEVDVSSVIAEAVGGVSADARDRGVTVAVHANGALPTVAGDVDALRSALQNIVGNAVKYSPRGAAVEVTAGARGETVQIRVVDRGLGIDATDLPHIFKPFYRGRRAVEAQVRGSGVGLSVVRHVIAAHKGTIAVDSRVGEGTTVVVELPANGIAHADIAADVGAAPGYGAAE